MYIEFDVMVEQERRRDELIGIQQEQLLRSSGIINPPWTYRWLAALGNSLVVLGTRLQQRYATLAASPASGLLSGDQQTPCTQ